MRRFRVWPALIGISGALLVFVGGPAALARLSLRWPAWIVPAIIAAAGVLSSIVISPLVTARVSVLVGRVAWFEDRRRRQTEILQRAMGSRQGLPLVRDVSSRRALGIHPAIPLPSNASHGLSPELPTYVPRDRDADVRTALTRMAQTGGFVLLVGPPVAGKTRSAANAIQELLGDWRIYLRSGPTDLEALLDADIDLRRTVVWLDDIHELLDNYGLQDQTEETDKLSARSVATPSGTGQVTSGVIRRLLLPSVGPVIIIGMTWPEQRDRLTAPVSPGTADPYADARRIIDMADQFDLSPVFSEQEWARAKQLSDFDPRLAEAVKFETSRAVAATLANAPELVRRWRHGSDDFGRAVLTAAVDARRCGYPEPIPKPLLAAIAETYLTGGQRAAAEPDKWFANALAWACSPVRGDIAPLTADSSRVGRIDGYRVSDILLDHANTSPDVEPVPTAVWQTVIEHADVGAYGSICVTARRAGLPEIAEMAGRRGADSNDPRSLYHLAALMADTGRPEEAEALYRRTIVAGGQDAMDNAMNNLANLLAQKGGTAEAEALYRKAIAVGSPEAIYNLAVLLERSGRAQEAEALYRRSAVDGHLGAVNNLAIMLADRGDLREAETLYRAAAEGGNIDALNNLAVLLRHRGRADEAEEFYRRAVDAGHVDALNNLANLLIDRGGATQAEALYRRAIAAGNTDALYNLALLLAETGRHDQGEALYRQAVSAGHPDASRNMNAYNRYRAADNGD